MTSHWENYKYTKKWGDLDPWGEMDQSNKTTFFDLFHKKYLSFTVKDLNKTLNICSDELQVA